MKSYDQIFTLEVNKSKEEIVHILKERGKVTLKNESIILDHNPAWYKIFAGRGTAQFILNKEDATKTVMQCILSPTIVNRRTVLMFLLFNILLWSALIYFSAGEVTMLIVFFVEWLIMAFIAIPFLIASVLLVTGYILSISFTLPSLFFIVISWSFLYLLLNAAMRYNRGEMKKWVVKIFREKASFKK